MQDHPENLNISKYNPDGQAKPDPEQEEVK